MKILICDDQAIVRDGLELLLQLEKDIEVSGTAEDGMQALDMIAKNQPDLVLMDLKMPGINGVETTRRILVAYPQIKVLVLTTFDDDEWVFDAIRAGAAGYLLKDTPRARVLEAIHGTMQGKSFIDPAVVGKLMDQVANKQEQPTSNISERLTVREMDVLRLISRGLGNGQIAKQLHLSEGTVRNHVSAIFAKLEISDRTQAAIIGIKHGLDSSRSF
ncbi:MAG: response regulator transcription factor [Anaerolineaceae bacterium]|nr:response regulator transcription factor [Anaerolineaceae bacterium]